MGNMIKYYLTPKAIKAGCKFEQPRNLDAGYDIYSSKNRVLFPNEAIWVSTGLYLQLPSAGLYPRVGLIRDRSSMADQYVHTHAGVIDAGYRSEIKIRLIYQPPNSDMRFNIDAGDKIAQMIIVQHLAWPTQMVNSIGNLGKTKRGSDGFGSTGA